MKKMRKVLALLLVAAMAMTLLCVGVFADGEKGSIKVPNESGHTYEIYQIFTGDYSDGKLSNVKWGQNGTGTKDAAVDETTLNAIKTATGTDAEKLATIQSYANLTGTPYKAEVSAGTTVAVDYGYYLIKDKDGSVSGDDSYTLYLVQVAGTVELTAKADKPSVEKKVYEDSMKKWMDSADYDIGDHVPFALTATMGDLSMYTKYEIQFDDNLTDGLTYDAGSAKVYVVNGDTKTEVTGQFTISTPATGDYDLLVSCTDILALKDSAGNKITVQQGTKIVVEYTATLNQNAKIGDAGNPNYVKLEYSNNPNDTGKGQTPEDKVIVFTYKLIVNKVDEAKKPLKGAGFTLYKLVDDSYVAVGGEKTGVTTFDWTGIDSGSYKLSETTTPPGYNTIADQYFTVTAEYDETAAEPKLTSLTATAVDGSTIELTEGAFDLGEGVMSQHATLSADIINKSGSVLPTTGGMGTTLFYVFGAILVLGAGVLLVTKKRMAHE